jgi:uncharacterized protein
MLLYFKTSNNLSFQDEIEFSMVAGSFTEHPENFIDIEKYKVNVLKSALIYGANASGKSNLLHAISNGIIFIQNSFLNSKSFDQMPFFHNLNDERNEIKPTHYVYGILINSIQFEYSFAFNNERILQEQLLEYKSQKPIQHFNRQFNVASGIYDWNFSSHFTGKKETVKDITNHKTLFLTIGSQTELPVAIHVFNWFNLGIVWSINSNSPGNLSLDYTLKLIRDYPHFKQEIINSLQMADFNIIDILVEETSAGLKGTTLHKSLNLEGIATSTPFDLTFQESAGTNRFIAWIGVWIDVLRKGQTILIDEFGTSIHTLLSKYLISEFHSKSNSKSQLIFTTHDTNLMTQEIFRRDQIWMVEKNKLGNSNLYSLSEFNIKKGKVLENSYLQGAYGGIPHIQQ